MSDSFLENLTLMILGGIGSLVISYLRKLRRDVNHLYKRVRDLEGK